MRSCAPVWLIVLALSASLGLAGCASFDELKATVTGSSAKFPGGDERVLSENPPEETERAEASKAAKKTDKPVRSRQPPQTVKLPRGSPASAPAGGGEAPRNRCEIRVVSDPPFAIAQSLAKIAGTWHIFTLNFRHGPQHATAHEVASGALRQDV